MLKQKTNLFSLLFVLIIWAPCVAIAAGDIQITCEPGIRIWLNNDFKGKTTIDDNGIFIEGLSQGNYIIKAAKTGFNPLRKTVNVLDGQTIEVKIKFTTPSVKIEQISPEKDTTLVQKVGTFILRSVPLKATVYIDNKEMGKTDIKVGNFPVGNHTVKFVFKNKELKGSFQLNSNESLKLKGHFKKNEILNETEIEKKEEERKRLEVERKRKKYQKRKVTNSLGMEFVYIPPGTFIMGSPSGEKGREKDEKQHRVTLTKGFYMQTTEVTVGQWREFILDSGYKTQAETGGGAWIGSGSKWEKKNGYYWDNPGFSQSESHPVTCVSWNDVWEFINWINRKEGKSYKLPTEAEWEHAGRAGSTTAFANGDISEIKCGYDLNLNAMGWYCYNANKRTHPVAQKNANAWGLYDMHGNIWEWCQDSCEWKNGVVNDTYRDGIVDPLNTNGSSRVSRGGCWDDNARHCRSANRRGCPPGDRATDMGFRLQRKL